jgi:nickel-type superoxide dismutase maturation protease
MSGRGDAAVLPWRTVRVAGGSMRPTLRDGDLLLCRRATGSDVRPGEVLVAVRPDRRDLTLVKRASHRDERGGWWVEGDDGAHSHDSWVFGPVPDDCVRAVVVARLWPRPGRVRST